MTYLLSLRSGIRWRFLLFSAPMALLGSCRESPTAIRPVASLQTDVSGGFVVSSPAELLAALSPENAGARVLVRAGEYAIETLLTIPDGVTLEGEGIMLFDPAGLPIGFTANSRTTLRLAANTPGDFVTLGDKVTIRNLEIVDLQGRAGGNPVAVVSRRPGDRVSATIFESVIVSPNPLGRTPNGPAGRGVLMGTRNLNGGAGPAPDEDAVIDLQMVRSQIVAPRGGGGLSAFNFARHGRISLTLRGNVVEGPNDINGGVSRPDAVHDAEVRVHSHGNVYRDGRLDPCVSPLAGWTLTGGSGPPLPITVPETARNTVYIYMVDDRIERFSTGVDAAGSRRFFDAPLAGPSTDNRIELQLLHTTVSTSPCISAADFRLAGALVTNDALTPGNGNRIRAEFRGVTGSGPRLNTYAGALGPSGPLPSHLEGTANRLSIIGSPEAFGRTNPGIDPPPPPQHFISTMH